VADAGAAAEHGIQIRSFGPVQATVVGDLPESRWINLVLGAAAPGAARDGHLEAAIEWVESTGVDYYVPVTPGFPGSEAAEAWLGGAGLGRGYGWMKFVRDTSPPETSEPAAVDVAELRTGEGEDFAEIVCAGFGLPPWAATLFEGLPGLPDWRCYVASVEGRPVASAAMIVGGELAEFGLAATLEAARGRGCQGALLGRRIRDAADAGCRSLLVETGERAPDRPSASYRNILRAGFREAYLRPNWQRSRS
jgi:GNAT superfamily N-acetyltransferase